MARVSEPLTGALEGTDIPFVLPMPDADISLVAKNEEDLVVGQCSAYRTVKYWDYVEQAKTNAGQQNRSTQAFLRIHEKAIADEKKHLDETGQSKEQSFHPELNQLEEDSFSIWCKKF
ncbi:MAG: hypothetical protein JSS53_07440 [Proteobacteria bacterium]|nr:hypothetical protein [Pseudomonadota bacterium]